MPERTCAVSAGKSLPPASVMARCASGYMLENPVYPALPRNVRQDVYHGDNVTGAENQQERLIEFRGWVIGFVDGEGCFSIGFVRQPRRPDRVGYKTGFQVTPRFTVTQGVQSLSVPRELKSFFGVGQVYRQPAARQPQGAPGPVRRAQARSICSETIIPFFERHPLRTSKRNDFEKFARCVGADRAGASSDAGGSDRDRRDQRRR